MKKGREQDAFGKEVRMKDVKKQITFRTFKKYCDCHEFDWDGAKRGLCAHKHNRTDKCTEGNCPIWKRLIDVLREDG